MYPLKFEPILKQTLWGGDKIIPFKHLNETLPNVGESWEVSAVEGSESVVANGADKGYTLPEMVRKYKEELVGEANYARFGNKFPLLIKFIDAKLDLSIQVHPDNAYALKNEHQWNICRSASNLRHRAGRCVLRPCRSCTWHWRRSIRCGNSTDFRHNLSYFRLQS